MSDSNSQRKRSTPWKVEQSGRRQFAITLAGLLLLGIALWLVYARSLHAPFIYDDPFCIVNNPSIVRLWPLIGDAQHPGPLNPSNDLPTAGRPLVNYTLALNYHFGQLDPFGYHLFNLIVHGLCAMLLWGIMRRTLELEFFGRRFNAGTANLLGFAAALLWALHPLQTEAVIYTTQRTELLVGFCYFATLYGSLRYWSAGAAAARITWLAVAITACFAGMACKEMMVTAPVIVLLFERTCLRGSFRDALANSWPLYLGLASSWLLLLALNYSAPRSDSAGFHLGLPAYVWWFTQAKVLWMYLQLAVWSWPLSIHYELPYLRTFAAAWPWLLLTAALVIATVVLLWRGKASGFCGAWFLIILSPTLIVPILTETAAERRMYLPLAGLVALAVVGTFCLIEWTARRLWTNKDLIFAGRKSAAATFSIVLLLAVIFGLVDVRRLDAYHDPITLWEELLAREPNDPTAHNNLAAALSAAGRNDEVIEHIQAALKLRPSLVIARFNLGVALGNAGRVPEAIDNVQQVLDAVPNFPDAHQVMGNLLVVAGRLPEAIEQYNEALRLRPDYPEAHNSLGKALVSSGRLPEALEQFQLAVQLKPDFAEGHFNFGAALVSASRPQEAAQQYQLAIQLQRDYPAAYNNLAGVYAQLQKPTEAIAVAEAALALARAKNRVDQAAQIENWLKQYRASLGNSAPKK